MLFLMQKTFLKNYHYLNDIQVKNFYHFLQFRLSKALKKIPNPTALDIDKFEFFASLFELFNVLVEEKIVVNELKKKKKQLYFRHSPYKFLYFNTNNFFLEGPEYTSRECFENGYTYNVKIWIESNFYDNGNLFKEIYEDFSKIVGKNLKKKKNLVFKNFWFKQKHLLCHLPFLTEEGTFIINGCERIIISQLIRSPGIYFIKEKYTNNFSKHLYNAYIISEKGKWTKITLLDSETFQPRLGIEINNKKLGEIWTKDILTHFFMDDGYKDGSLSFYYLLNEFGLNLSEISSLIQNPGYLPSEILRTNFENHTSSLLKTPSSLDFNKVLFFENFKKFLDLLKKIFKSKISIKTKKILFESFFDEFYNSQYGCFLVGEIGRLQINEKLGVNLNNNVHYITPIDLLGILNGLIKLKYFDKKTDDIDHLKNKWIRSVGDLFSYQISSVLSKSSFLKNLEITTKGINFIDEKILEIKKNEISSIIPQKANTFEIFKMTKNFEKKVPLDNFSIKKSIKLHLFLDSYLAEFCNSSPLVQLTQLANQLSLLNQKRKFSLLGPLGLNADQVSIELRDIHPSKYSKICYIETADGPRVGLVSSLSLVGHVNTQGFLETPYFLKNKQKNFIAKNYIYLNSLDETKTTVEISNSSVINNDFGQKITVKQDYNFLDKKKENVLFGNISPFQTFSIGISLVPFLEHDDATRVLMGSNMQRQAVSLLFPQKAIVGTGVETNVCHASGMCLKSYSEGHIIYSDNYKIKVRDLFNQEIIYPLKKYKKAYQDTCFTQKSCVWNNEKIFSGQIIADGPGSIDGELTLGTNLTVAYMPWFGYNYEDAIVISSKILENNNLTSIHITEHEIFLYELEIYKYDFFDRKKNRKKEKNSRTNITGEEKFQYPEHLSKNVFIANPYLKRHLNSFGLVKIGSYVKKNDILLGKVKIIPTTSANPYIRLLNAILKKDKNEPLMKDISIHMEAFSGRVIAIKSVNQNFITCSDKYDSNLVKIIKVYTIQLRKVEVGDKLSGRHGNKGVISKILEKQDMPYLMDGSPVDIILNPLGVPSRMNVGQIFESTLGFAGYKIGKRYKIDCFDESYVTDASRLLITQKLKQASYENNLNSIFNPTNFGKMLLRDGRTGEFFDNPISIGKSYILKLIHLVEDKFHARATGSYSLINEQPLAGRASNGGQRFGEMEVWAMEAYGSSYTLHELLTIKSDDYDGRNDIYEVLASKKKKLKPTLNICESYITLIRHLNSIGLNFSFKTVSKNRLKEEKIFINLEKRLKLRALLEKKEIETRDPNLEKLLTQNIEEEVKNFYRKIKGF